MVNQRKSEPQYYKKRKSKGVYAVFDDFNQDEFTSEGEPKHPYYKAMCSKWMQNVPSDLKDNWFFKVCPVGKRAIVVASKNITKVYNKRGISKTSFQSALPGGNNTYNGQRYTVLDCIHNQKSNIFYVLDVIAWNNFPYTKCSTEVRFFTLYSRFYEIDGLQEITSRNSASFQLLPYYECHSNTLQQALSNPMCKLAYSEFLIDGVLFFNKDARYLRQESSMVRWAKPYMIPELLSIPIAEAFYAERPTWYTNIEDFIEKDEERILAAKTKPDDKRESNNKKNNMANDYTDIPNCYEENGHEMGWQTYTRDLYQPPNNRIDNFQSENNWNKNYNSFNTKNNKNYQLPISEENAFTHHAQHQDLRTNHNSQDSNNKKQDFNNVLENIILNTQKPENALRNVHFEEFLINTQLQVQANGNKEEENASANIQPSVSPFFNKDLDTFGGEKSRVTKPAFTNNKNLEEILEKSQFYIKGKGPIDFNEFKPRNQYYTNDYTGMKQHTRWGCRDLQEENNIPTFTTDLKYITDARSSSRCDSRTSMKSRSFERDSNYSATSEFFNVNPSSSSTFPGYISDLHNLKYKRWTDNADNTLSQRNSRTTNIELGDYHSFQPFTQIQEYAEEYDEKNSETFHETVMHQTAPAQDFEQYHYKFDKESFFRKSSPVRRREEAANINNLFDYTALQCYMDEQTALEQPETPQKLQKDKRRQYFDELYFSKCVKNIRLPVEQNYDSLDEVPMDLTLPLNYTENNSPNTRRAF